MASSDRSPTRQSPRKKGDAQASMTPHLAPCGFPQDSQPVSLSAASSSAAPPINAAPSAAPPIAAATSDAESANEDDTTKELNWVIEGVEGFGEEQTRHMNAFYALLKKEIHKKEYTSKLLTKKDYDERVNVILGVRDKTTDCREGYLGGNYLAYKWLERYHVFTCGTESAVLVLRPDPAKGAVDVTTMAPSSLQRPTYIERFFSDLWKIHKDDHCKGKTFFTRVRNTHGNVTRDVCKLFTDVCPHCIVVLSRRKPAAGIKPIITVGMGVRGQVDIIDFQSMPDGLFKYLLNYIDHGVKYLVCIPLSSKRAAAVAYALFTIFTEIGPPSILQSDNGGEFSNQAHDHRGHKILLDDDFIDSVIHELKNLWPECQMVRGSPRHSESNGGVERVNQTFQKKLGGWMKTNATNHWSIGCKIVQWRINTQHHSTVKDTPYHLVYGMHPRVGISNLPLSDTVLTKLLTEAQLNEVVSEMTEAPNPAAPVLPESFQGQVAAVADAARADPMLTMSPLETNKRKRKTTSEEDKRASRDIVRAKRDAMKDAVLPEPTTNRNIRDTTPNDSVVPMKSAADAEVSNRWLELYEEREGAVTIEEISRARPGGPMGKQFPIIRCFNNKDITDDANWAPSILVKVRNDLFEVMDVNDDIKVDNDMDWDGDDGLFNTWSTYYKYPSKQSVDAYRTTLQVAYEEVQAHDVSPRRNDLRNRAAQNLAKKAEYTKGRILKNSPDLVVKVGDVVLVPLDDVDRTKVDGGNLCGVVVSMNQNSICRVAVQQGLLHRGYVYHSLQVVPDTANDIDLHNLRDAFENWRSLPKLTEREAAKYVSSVGGQGIIHCNCRGECKSNQCSCKRAGRLCSSRCHRNNSKCQNKTEPELVNNGK